MTNINSIKKKKVDSKNKFSKKKKNYIHKKSIKNNKMNFLKGGDGSIGDFDAWKREDQTIAILDQFTNPPTPETRFLPNDQKLLIAIIFLFSKFPHGADLSKQLLYIKNDLSISEKLAIQNYVSTAPGDSGQPTWYHRMNNFLTRQLTVRDQFMQQMFYEPPSENHNCTIECKADIRNLQNIFNKIIPTERDFFVYRGQADYTFPDHTDWDINYFMNNPHAPLADKHRGYIFKYDKFLSSSITIDVAKNFISYFLDEPIEQNGNRLPCPTPPGKRSLEIFKIKIPKGSRIIPLVDLNTIFSSDFCDQVNQINNTDKSFYDLISTTIKDKVQTEIEKIFLPSKLKKTDNKLFDYLKKMAKLNPHPDSEPYKNRSLPRRVKPALECEILLCDRGVLKKTGDPTPDSLEKINIDGTMVNVIELEYCDPWQWHNTINEIERINERQKNIVKDIETMINKINEKTSELKKLVYEALKNLCDSNNRLYITSTSTSMSDEVGRNIISNVIENESKKHVRELDKIFSVLLVLYDNLGDNILDYEEVKRDYSIIFNNIAIEGNEGTPADISSTNFQDQMRSSNDFLNLLNYSYNIMNNSYDDYRINWYSTTFPIYEPINTNATIKSLRSLYANYNVADFTFNKTACTEQTLNTSILNLPDQEQIKKYVDISQFSSSGHSSPTDPFEAYALH